MMKYFLTFLLLPFSVFAEEIKISSFNVNFANTNIQETLALIHEFAPDVLLLQESTPLLEKGVKVFLPDEYTHAWFTNAAQNSGGGFGVVSKFPIVNRKFIEKSKGLFGTQTFGVKLKGGTVRFMNVHLNPAGLPEAHSAGTALHAMIMNNKVQVFEVRNILQEYDEQQPTVFAGDVNSFSNLAAYKILTRAGFTDAHLSVDENAGQVSTWRAEGANAQGEGRFDYVFHNALLAAKAFEVVENTYSDHALLNCTLRLR